MSKKYHLTPDQAAFVHLINSAFAGIDFSIDLAVNPPAGVKKISKKALIEAIKATLAQTNQALTSEYIRGELVKEGILEDGGQELCVFDPSDANKDQDTEVFTPEDLQALRLDKAKATWKNKVKGK